LRGGMGWWNGWDGGENEFAGVWRSVPEFFGGGRRMIWTRRKVSAWMNRF
jgi:hypothetical protein